MSSLSNTRLPEPKDWQTFERQIHTLFKCVLNDPNTRLHGRQGQKQHGIDVYGYRDENPKRLVGVQCKKKYREKVTDDELKAELKKAKRFVPAITEFILVTTAPRDAHIQKTARTLTKGFSKTPRPIAVQVWGWEDIEDEASKYDEAWKAFDPTFNPFAERSHHELSAQISELRQLVETIHSNASVDKTPRISIPEAETAAEVTALGAKITAYQALIDEGHVHAALSQLKKLQATEWDAASPSERFRILANQAAAHWRLGAQLKAGELLLAAHDQRPDHPKARLSKAKGLLLTDKFSDAMQLAVEIVAQEPDNADAAGVIVEARNYLNGEVDALDGIPPLLHETEPVTIAFAHFLRCRGDTRWIDIVIEGEKRFPDSAILVRFAAEAKLDRFLGAFPYALAGAPVPLSDRDTLTSAAMTLARSAEDAIRDNTDLPTSLAHNAALALRICGREDQAKDILDNALKVHSDDLALRVQRAILARSEGDPQKALDLLTPAPTDYEATCVRAEALVSLGRPEEALESVRHIDPNSASQNVRLGVVDIQVRAHRNLGQNDTALAKIADAIKAHPLDTMLHALYVRTMRTIKGHDQAKPLLNTALETVVETTPFLSRLELAHEAWSLRQYGTVIALLDDYVAKDRINEGLTMLIAATINGNYPIRARAVLESVKGEAATHPDILRARAILALNVGDPEAEKLIVRYLEVEPDDLEMSLTRISVWQRHNRDKAIRKELKSLLVRQIRGAPHLTMKLAALVMHYLSPSDGLELGYRTLLSNWANPKAHLRYHGLILVNNDVGDAIPPGARVEENFVVELKNKEGEQRRYRIENLDIAAFSAERIGTADDLAKILAGKKVGDNVKFQDRVGAKIWTIVSIKHVWLDALHRSLSEFNERFPRAQGLLSFTVDAKADDPLDEIRAATKAIAERDQQALDLYEKGGIPLAFLAPLIGKDPLDAWQGLPSVEKHFRVCRGTGPERQDAFKILEGRAPKGCVVDSITLSVIRRLEIGDVVENLCGPIHTTQSVVDLLAHRKAESEQTKATEGGFLAYRDGQLQYYKYTAAQLAEAASQRSQEYDWAKKQCTLVQAVPKADLEGLNRTLIEQFPHHVSDPAIAAQGADLLLVSEDMGYRHWATEALEVQSVWLQPILMLAYRNGVLTAKRYCEAVNMLALGGHRYTSASSETLLHQAEKDNFVVSAELKILLETLGGPLADLDSNSDVAAGLLQSLYEKDVDWVAVHAIASSVFWAFTRGHAKPRELLALIVNKVKRWRSDLSDHALGWLVGHSIGQPEFDDLLTLHREAMRRVSVQI